MQIHLAIPGLIWPCASVINPVADLELPALTRLLGAGTRHTEDFQPLDQRLARVFGWPAAERDDAPLPLALLRRLGESVPPGSAEAQEWLCADPVNLSFAREHLLLNEFPADEFTGEETSALIASLNEHFADLGQFEAATSNRWYLRLAAPTRARLYPLHDVVGRPIKHFLPEGPDERLWQRTMNEVQVLLHNHPVNQAREAAGLRPANSLWFWGAGKLPAHVPCPAAAVHARDPLSAGFARAAGIEPQAPDPASAFADGALVVLDNLLKPALQLDIDRWRAELGALERDWLTPALTALRARRLKALRITAPGDRGTLVLDVTRTDLWKFWRQPLPFARLLTSFAPPPLAPDATSARDRS